MKSLTIFTFLLAVTLASALKIMRGHVNYTVHRQRFKPVLKEMNAGFLPRIINGKIAERTQFPYQAGLEFDHGDEFEWCGGAVISEEWVLTAAHCIIDAKSVIVELGMLKLFDAKARFLVGKGKILAHVDYDERTDRADIALINIPPVKFSEFIQPIGLPQNRLPFPTYVGTYGIASGWGRTQSSVAALSTYLRYARVKIIENSNCKKIFGEDTIYAGKLCTLGGDATCKADSGGPLLSESTSTLIGIISFGAIDGCGKGYPDAFTRVDFYLNWIKQITKMKIL